MNKVQQRDLCDKCFFIPPCRLCTYVNARGVSNRPKIDVRGVFPNVDKHIFKGREYLC